MVVSDPVANKQERMEEYGIKLIDFEEIDGIDAVVLAVSDSKYRNMNISDFSKLYYGNDALDEVVVALEVNEKNILIDVKGIMDKDSIDKRRYIYWRL